MIMALAALIWSPQRVAASTLVRFGATEVVHPFDAFRRRIFLSGTLPPRALAPKLVLERLSISTYARFEPWEAVGEQATGEC